MWLGDYRHGHNAQKVHAVSLAEFTGFSKILHGIYRALSRHCTVLVQKKVSITPNGKSASMRVSHFPLR